MNNLIGQHLGPYRILEQIGVGGMATVYKAYQPAMDRYVAVKVMASNFAQDETFLRRFRREARAVAQLEHTHILPVHDYGEAEGRPYLVMRYLEAGTLKDRMAEGPLPMSEVNRIIGQVGSALDYAHRMGVIHRDVKPTNVLLDAEGNVFLTDFGLAKMMESSVHLTETGVGIGTPTYMSPEQGRGAKVDSRSDVYSLGVMLYEMVTGRPPYAAETPLALVLKHIQEPLPLPRSIRPDLPQEVERVTLRALAKEPNDRFQTAGEMVRALDASVQAAEAAARTEPAVLTARVEPVVAKLSAPRAGGFLAQAVAGMRETLPARWARASVWMIVGIVALLAFFFVLSRVPLRVQISGGQLEVVRVVEVTPALPAPAGEAQVSEAEGATQGVIAVPETPTQAAAAKTAATTTPWPTTTPMARLTVRPTLTATSRPAAVAEPTEVPSAAPFLRVAVSALAVDPNDPETILAGTYGAGIYVSRDGGRSWSPGNGGLGKGTVGSIVVDPNNSNVVYAGLFDQGGVYKSTDGGQTWSAANRGINLDGAWDWTGLVYLDPTDSSRLYYTGTTNGLYHSSDGGANWQQRGADCPSISGLAVDSNDGEHLYASAYRPDATCPAGVYESHDGGRTWKGLTTEEMIYPSDEFGSEWWHLAADPKDSNTLYAGGRRGTYRTSDGGRSWTPILDQGCDWLVASELVLYCGTGGDLLISLDDGQSWEMVFFGSGGGRQEMRPLAVAPSNPQTLYVGVDAMMRSTDGGWTWNPAGWLGAAGRMRVTVDPRDGSRLFLSGVDYVHEVFRSENRGRTWQVIANHGGWYTRITIDPVQDVIYLPSSWGDLYRSSDNGQTWQAFGSGYPTHRPWQLVPDPRDVKRLWLIGDGGPRLSLSEDGGETFAIVDSFPQGVNLLILLISRDGRRMYVVAWGGFYRSDDGGGTWHSLGGPGGIYRAAALDPLNPDAVYVGSTHKGVLKTTNAGYSWRQVNNGLTNPSINELAIDPANPQTIYAATDGGAFVSVNGGENWLPLQEELGPNPIVYSIAVDPNDPSQIYAVTPDGVFRLRGASAEVAAPAPTPTNTPTRMLSPTPIPTSVQTSMHTPVKVSISGDVVCSLTGPAGDPAARNPQTLLHADVQSDHVAQVAVESPSGETFVLLPFGDVFGWERRFHASIPGLPQTAGTYTFTALDTEGTPIPGAVASDVYVGGGEPDPPVNVQAEVVETGILVTWDPSAVIPGAFDPGGSPPLGSYLISLNREEVESTYGWTQAGGPLLETSHLIPFRRHDFGPGDRGLALEEMGDGIYYLRLFTFSIEPEGTAGQDKECMAHDPVENIRIVIEGGHVRIEGP